jgi:ABC-type multidrug transport system fused ATPase/permease subunit
MKQMIDKATGKVLTRSEAEARIKDKAGLVIVIMALFLAGNTYLANGFSGTAQTKLLQATNTYGFFQAKSIKQSIAEGQQEDAKLRNDKQRVKELQAKIDRYESDPVKGEGKKELLAKAKQQEAERESARAHGPWLTFAGMLFQLAIVLLSASILAVNIRMYYGSILVGMLGAFLMAQGYWMFM